MRDRRGRDRRGRDWGRDWGRDRRERDRRERDRRGGGGSRNGHWEIKRRSFVTIMAVYAMGE